MLSGVSVTQSGRSGGTVREGVTAEADAELCAWLLGRLGATVQTAGMPSAQQHAAGASGKAVVCLGSPASRL